VVSINEKPLHGSPSTAQQEKHGEVKGSRSNCLFFKKKKKKKPSPSGEGS